MGLKILNAPPATELKNTNFNSFLKLFEDQNYEAVVSAYEAPNQASFNCVATLKIVAASFQRLNRTNDELQVLSKVLELNPSDAQACFNAGVIHLERQDFNTAIIFFKTASILMPENTDTLLNLGICYKELGDLKKATQQYQLTLDIDPNNEGASLNLGNIFAKNGNKDSAISCYLNAMKANPANLETQFNLALLFLENGDVLQAAANFYHLLKSNPAFEKAGIRFQQLCCQIDDLEADKALASYLGNEAVINKLSTFRLFHVINAIGAFKSGDYGRSKQSLDASKSVSNQSLQPVLEGVDGDEHFCNAYSIFLLSLISEPRKTVSKDLPQMFHIGESHSLSFANREIVINETAHRIHPKLCLGIKAFHLAQSKNNKYKSLFHHHFLSIPKQSNVFISIGEIDCRPDEGFITASKKTGNSIQQLVNKTVAGYLKHLEKLNCSKEHQIWLLNVPAPVEKAKFTKEQNQASADVVEMFNEALFDHTQKSTLKVVDVYSKTRGANGISNGIYHCDDTHLGYKALKVLQSSVAG